MADAMNKPPIPKRRILPALLLAAFAAASCGRKPAEVRVTPAKAQLFGKDRRATFKAEVLDKKGNPFQEPPPTWSSSNPKVATVEPAGLVKSVGPGRAQISASVGTLSGTATVDVVDVAALVVTPARATLLGPVGTTLQLASEAKNASGQPVDQCAHVRPWRPKLF